MTRDALYLSIIAVLLLLMGAEFNFCMRHYAYLDSMLNEIMDFKGDINGR